MTDNMKHAFENGRAWYQTIKDLTDRLNLAEKQVDERGSGDEAETLRREIEEGPLSVMVRDAWRQPGTQSDEPAEEYEILLSTGGPALRIWGKLDRYGQPDTAELQAQDWGTPWTRVPDCDHQTLLSYAGCFYFGEA